MKERRKEGRTDGWKDGRMIRKKGRYDLPLFFCIVHPFLPRWTRLRGCEGEREREEEEGGREEREGGRRGREGGEVGKERGG
jgi:hypothetical protein